MVTLKQVRDSLGKSKPTLCRVMKELGIEAVRCDNNRSKKQITESEFTLLQDHFIANGILREVDDRAIDLRLNKILCSARGRCKKNGREFQLTREQIREVHNRQGGLCFYTGRKMTLCPGNDAFSLDRVDSTQGYTPNNVVLCCKGFNWIKNTLSIEEMQSFCADFLNMHPLVPK